MTLKRALIATAAFLLLWGASLAHAKTQRLLGTWIALKVTKANGKNVTPRGEKLYLTFKKGGVLLTKITKTRGGKTQTQTKKGTWKKLSKNRLFCNISGNKVTMRYRFTSEGLSLTNTRGKETVVLERFKKSK